MQSSTTTPPPSPQHDTMSVFSIWLRARSTRTLNTQNTGCSQLITITTLKLN